MGRPEHCLLTVNAMHKLLILSDCGTAVPDFSSEFSVTALPTDAAPSERLRALREAEIVIGEPTLSELAEASKLRWVQMTWAGADRYLHGGFPKNVRLTTASGAYGVTIAEHAIAMLLSLCRHLPSYQVRKDAIDLGSEIAVSGKTALVFGTGDIGRNIARRLCAFDVRCIGVRKNCAEKLPEFAEMTDLNGAERYLPQADFVFCALPETAQTVGWLSAARLEKLPIGAMVINVGRGSFVDTAALTQALQSGALGGVGLDVTEPEPLPAEHPLRRTDRAILTPHVAGIGFGHLPETTEKIWAICRENLSRYLSDAPLLNQVTLP